MPGYNSVISALPPIVIAVWPCRLYASRWLSRTRGERWTCPSGSRLRTPRSRCATRCVPTTRSPISASSLVSTSCCRFLPTRSPVWPRSAGAPGAPVGARTCWRSPHRRHCGPASPTTPVRPAAFRMRSWPTPGRTWSGGWRSTPVCRSRDTCRPGSSPSSREVTCGFRLAVRGVRCTAPPRSRSWELLRSRPNARVRALAGRPMSRPARRLPPTRLHLPGFRARPAVARGRRSPAPLRPGLARVGFRSAVHRSPAVLRCRLPRSSAPGLPVPAPRLAPRSVRAPRLAPPRSARATRPVPLRSVRAARRQGRGLSRVELRGVVFRCVPRVCPRVRRRRPACPCALRRRSTRQGCPPRPRPRLPHRLRLLRPRPGVRETSMFRRPTSRRRSRVTSRERPALRPPRRRCPPATRSAVARRPRGGTPTRCPSGRTTTRAARCRI
ncbi:hypothetical protein BXY51_006429 [Actinoplanes cyaneus]|nr:hypothetical protein [Actinoplanes cyaneus]